MHIVSLLGSALSAFIFTCAIYIGLLVTLTIPSLQTHVIYLYKVTLTWFQDVNQPMQWGFLPDQVTPFFLQTPDKELLHAWHILPIGLYQQHEAELLTEAPGLTSNFSQRLAFKLLRNDPESLLVLYLHGAAGTLGSGWRPASYRAMHALAPNRIHTVAIDYRGFGESSGHPSEDGLLTDAHALLSWATKEARIPPHRIVLFAQSLGTAVALSLAYDLAVLRPKPVYLRGIVLVAPFADVADLTSTYSIAGTIPLPGPLARFPVLHTFFKTFLICKWPSKEKLAGLIGAAEHSSGARYDITLIHAKDDRDIPWSHSETFFWHAVRASSPNEIQYEKALGLITRGKEPLGSEGWRLRCETSHGVLRQEILEHGLHDRIMSYPLVGLAIWRAFQGSDEPVKNTL